MTIHGRKVTPTKPKATPWKIRECISDDALWLNPRMSYADWSQLLGYHTKAIQRDAIARGWVREGQQHAFRIVRAPCVDCSRPTPVERLDAHRQCAECQNVARIEDTRRRLAELAAWRASLRRSA